MIEKVVIKTNNKDKSSDVKYWLSQPPESRLQHLEEIRNEYNSWKYAEQGFQRVYRIVKQK